MVLIFAVGCCAPRQGLQLDVTLPDIVGATHRIANTPGDLTSTVLIFIRSDCPISNAYAPEINRLVKRYSGANDDGVRPLKFLLVHVDPDLPIDEAKQHAVDYGFQCPVLLDRSHELVRAIGATVTPEGAVISHDGRLVYRGRIDDRYVDLGKRRLEPSTRDLKDAIEAVIHHRAVANRRTRAVGCLIPE
jgi:hypothetical protein